MSLQPGLSGVERAMLAAHANVTALDRELATMDETAAIVAAVDLVVSVDTSLAHLAGALGQATWILLPANADWRWQRAREDSPWYPSARLIRQPRIGAWPEVVETVIARLKVQANA